MDQSLGYKLISTAYKLDKETLRPILQQNQGKEWDDFAKSLDFKVWDTGGGSLMLLAHTTMGHIIGLTDGEAGLPTSSNYFYLEINREDDEGKLYASIFNNGIIERLTL